MKTRDVVDKVDYLYYSHFGGNELVNFVNSVPDVDLIEKGRNCLRQPVLSFKGLSFKRRKNEISNEDCRGSPSLAMTFFLT